MQHNLRRRNVVQKKNSSEPEVVHERRIVGIFPKQHLGSSVEQSRKRERTISQEPSDWQIVLRNPEENTTVVFHEPTSSFEVYSGDTDLLYQDDLLPNRDTKRCHYCGSTKKESNDPKLEKPFVDPKYFEFMEDAHRASSGPFEEGEPDGSFVTGYYSKFFRQLEKLGTGSYGSVYLCQHILNKVTLGTYAVKKIALSDNPEWQSRAFREVKALEYLHHPNIVTYKHTWIEQAKLSDFGPEIPCLFILMEYANSGNLDNFISQDKIISEVTDSDLWKTLDHVAKALSHLHHHGLCHRDIKPANILLHRERDVISGKVDAHIMLTDFGQSEFLKSDQRLPRTGYTGTMLYTAPELLIKEGEFDESCDMYSLGAVMFALAFGKAPFQHLETSGIDLDHNTIHNHILSDDISVPVFPERSPNFIKLILQLLNPNRTLRPSADEVIARIGREYQSIPRTRTPSYGSSEEPVMLKALPPLAQRRSTHVPRAVNIFRILRNHPFCLYGAIKLWFLFEICDRNWLKMILVFGALFSHLIELSRQADETIDTVSYTTACINSVASIAWYFYLLWKPEPATALVIVMILFESMSFVHLRNLWIS